MVENLFINDWGGIIWDRRGNFSKFNDRGSHRGASDRTFGQGVFISSCTVEAYRSKFRRIILVRMSELCEALEGFKFSNSSRLLEHTTSF